jgi:hypothetical protein
MMVATVGTMVAAITRGGDEGVIVERGQQNEEVTSFRSG